MPNGKSAAVNAIVSRSPALAVNWSPNNVPSAGDKSMGQIGTSHFSPSENEIYVLGKLERVGVDLAEVTRTLEVEGVDKFVTSWTDLLLTVERGLGEAR